MSAPTEADTQTEGRSPAGLKVRRYVDAVAKHDRYRTEAEIATVTFRVFALAGLSRWQRIKLAWKVIR